jgi:fructose-specific component phosphotransferase system IIB-like protein
MGGEMTKRKSLDEILEKFYIERNYALGSASAYVDKKVATTQAKQAIIELIKSAELEDKDDVFVDGELCQLGDSGYTKGKSEQMKAILNKLKGE